MNTKSQLKSEIKNLADEGRRIRIEKIRPSLDYARYEAWEEKRKVGSRARLFLLAYAFFRGVPYRVVEKKCKEDEEKVYRNILAYRIHKTLLSVLPQYEHEE